MDSEPISSEERMKRSHVRGFVKIIDQVFASKGIEQANNYNESPGEYKVVPLLDPQRPGLALRLSIDFIPNGALGNEIEFESALNNFSYPRYAVSIWTYGDFDELVQTPYGNQRKKVIDKEGKLWLFSNYYLFDEEGCSKRVFEALLPPHQETDWGKDKARDLYGITPDIADKIKTDFIPKTEETRFYDLTGQDFEKLGYFLDQAARRKIKPEFI